jgi:hypothetical protein
MHMLVVTEVVLYETTKLSCSSTFHKKIINIFFMEQIEVLLCNEVLILHILQQYQF